jgi:hypothetical protein
VTGVRVDLKEKRAWVSCGSEVSPEQVVAAIESSGRFEAKLVEP